MCLASAANWQRVLGGVGGQGGQKVIVVAHVQYANRLAGAGDAAEVWGGTHVPMLYTMASASLEVAGVPSMTSCVPLQSALVEHTAVAAPPPHPAGQPGWGTIT